MMFVYLPTTSWDTSTGYLMKKRRLLHKNIRAARIVLKVLEQRAYRSALLPKEKTTNFLSRSKYNKRKLPWENHECVKFWSKFPSELQAYYNYMASNVIDGRYTPNRFFSKLSTSALKERRLIFLEESRDYVAKSCRLMVKKYPDTYKRFW